MTKGKLVALGSAAYFALLTAGWATPVEYSVRDVGYVVGVAVNDLGQVTGYAFHDTPDDPSYGPFLTGANGIGLHTLGPFPSLAVLPNGINNAGQVTGTFFDAGSLTAHPFLTGPNGTAPRDLGFRGFARDVNNIGQVAGFADPRPGQGRRIFLTSADGLSVNFIGTLPANSGLAGVVAVNDLGQVAVVVGFPIGDPVYHSLLSGPDGGALRDLGTFNGEQILVTDVNDLGQVVGYSPADAFLEKVHAFVSAPDAGAFTDLGVLFRNTSSSASAINDAGVVVGTNTTHNGPNVGFVYTLANGMQDLNTLINPDLNFHFEEAIDINERGQILATGYLNNQFHTYLLTPFNVPDEASTVILLGLSLVSLAVLARRHHPCGAPTDH